jgi:hypothetical protein
MELQINVPTSLNEISLKSYQAFIAMQEKSNDEEFIAQKMIEIFCDITLKDIVKIKLTSLNELIGHFTNLFAEKPKFQPTFKIKNIEFGFIPELEEITFGEYVDLDSSLNNWQTFHKAMAVLYRPIKRRIGEKYEIEDYNPNPDMQDLMRFAPLDVCIAASLFFWNLEKELLPVTLNYLEKEIKKNPEALMTFQKQLNLQNSGDGINQFMHLLREMLEDSTKLPNYDLLNASRFSHLKNKKQRLKKDNLKDN